MSYTASKNKLVTVPRAYSPKRQPNYFNFHSQRVRWIHQHGLGRKTPYNIGSNKDKRERRELKKLERLAQVRAT